MQNNIIILFWVTNGFYNKKTQNKKNVKNVNKCLQNKARKACKTFFYLWFYGCRHVVIIGPMEYVDTVAATSLQRRAKANAPAARC